MAEKIKLPSIDSIHELAQFWDSHEITDFEDELEEVDGTIFERDSNHESISVFLDHNDFPILKRIAQQLGKNEKDLVKEWVQNKIHEYC